MFYAKYIQAQRLKAIPPYFFAELDKKKDEIRAKGKDLIDLSVGDPDLPPPAFLINELKKTLHEQEYYRYPPYKGTREFCEAVAWWYQHRWGVKINPVTEVWSLIGSKEGLVHLPLAVVNPGDYVGVPDPCFPCYRSAVAFAGGRIHHLPLRRENNFLPDLSAIKPAVANKMKLIFLNYPNNPTSAVATKEFYQDIIKFARKYGIVICQDNAYAEVYYDKPPVSFLSVPGAKEVGVETGSFTKMFNVAGWRVGWMVGNAGVIKALGAIKSNTDSGLWTAFQKACVVALHKGKPAMERFRQVYRRRREMVARALEIIGWEFHLPEATYFFWIKVPVGYTSMSFSQRLLEELYIAVTPGVGFGAKGEGYIRISLTISEARLREAIKRLQTLK